MYSMNFWMNLNIKQKLTILCFGAMLALGLFLRLYYINFGLPHVTFADEDKLGNPGIVFSYQLKDIVKNKEFVRLAPTDFVYGTFSLYLNSIIILIYKVVLKVFNKDIDFLGSYTILRIVNALISLSIVPVISYLYYKVFRGKFGAVLTALFLALNWKLIVHAHYLNADILLTTLLSMSYLTFYFYLSSEKAKSYKFLIFTAVLFGLSVGTKVTALISLPLYLILIFKKSGVKGLFLFITPSFLFYLISNPFTFIYWDKFMSRVNEMRIKENGIVFDSVDFGRFKYVFALSFMVTPLVLFGSIYGMFKALTCKKNFYFHIFAILQILTYFLFFSFSLRRVDRWLLPVLLLIIFYASYLLSVLRTHLEKARCIYKILYFVVFTLLIGNYLYYPFQLLKQFNRYTPQVEAFLWSKQNIKTPSPKLLITDSSLDPTRGITGIKVLKVNIYSSEGAQNKIPPDPYIYEYIVTLSRPLRRYQNPTLRLIFPQYYKIWNEFDNSITNSSDFVLVKSFNMPEPNIIPLSSVYIYKNLKYVPIVPITNGN